MSCTLYVISRGGSHIVRDTIRLPCYQRTRIFQGFKLCVGHVLSALQVIFARTVAKGRNDRDCILILLRIACERGVSRYAYVQHVKHHGLRAEDSTHAHAIRCAFDPVARVERDGQIFAVDHTFAARN